MARVNFDNFVEKAAILTTTGTALYMAPVLTPPAIVSAVFAGFMMPKVISPALSTDPKVKKEYFNLKYKGEERTINLKQMDIYSKSLEKSPKATRVGCFVAAVATNAVSAILVTAIFQVGLNFLLGGSATLLGGLAITAIGGALAYNQIPLGKPLLAAGLVLTSMIALPMLGHTIPGFTLSAGSSFALPYKAAAWGGYVGTVAAAALYLVRDVFFAQNSGQPLNAKVKQA